MEFFLLMLMMWFEGTVKHVDLIMFVRSGVNLHLGIKKPCIFLIRGWTFPKHRLHEKPIFFSKHPRSLFF